MHQLEDTLHTHIPVHIHIDTQVEVISHVYVHTLVLQVEIISHV